MKTMPYRGNKNQNVIHYGKYEKTEEEFEAYRWCINNGIIIFPECKLTSPWAIEIKIKNKVYKSPDQYHAIEVWEKMYEYYKYYYNKYGKNSI